MLRDARRTAQKQMLGFDEPNDPTLDRLSRLANRMLCTPTALVVIADADRLKVIGSAELPEPTDRWAAIRLSPLVPRCCRYVVAQAAPLIVDDARTHPMLQPVSAADPGMLAYVGMPLIAGDGIARGAFCVADTVPRDWTADELGTLRDLAQLVMDELDLQAQALARAAAEQAGRDRLQTLATQLLHAQEAERRAIARELHDEIGQELTIMQMGLQDLLDVDPAQLPEHVEESIATIERVLAQVRAMALDLRPSQLDDLGLEESLRWYLERQAARGHLEIVFDLPPLTPRPPADVETTCFRIAQEAMTNILRSAHATHVWMTIARDADGLTLTVRDDGYGFDVAAARARAMHGSSLGLLSMEERAALIGGHTSIESAPGQGTIVRAWLPLRATSAAEAM